MGVNLESTAVEGRSGICANWHKIQKPPERGSSSCPRKEGSKRGFGATSRRRSGCKRWWQLEEPLRHALDLRLWHFPTVSRHAADPQYAWPEDSKQARWL